MRVRILKNMAGLDFSFIAGQIVDVPDKEAKSWLRAGLAEVIEVETASIEQPEKAILPKGKRKKVK